MRLLTWTDSNEFSVTEDSPNDAIPPYAILSHTWGADDDELSFADIRQCQGHDKVGYSKLQFCKEQAERDGYQYIWIDTCCINKDSLSELSEAIVSMFNWYKNAQKCYVYLTDVSSDVDNAPQAVEASFRTSRWFTRGWTLQELLAPRVVEFFSQEGKLLGTKVHWAQQIHEITGIALSALYGAPLVGFPISERMQWAAQRKTKKKEDKAYCLLGIFQVFLPLMYGEGDNAFRRLESEINNQFGKGLSRTEGTDSTAQKAVEIRSLGLALNLAPTIDAENFIGRAAELADMASILLPENTSKEQRRVVLGGIGGIGKTQMATAFARQYQHHYSSVIWLNATSELTLFGSFRSLAQSLDSSEVASFDNDQVLTHVHYWLSRPTNTRWLLIFDNHDDPDQFEINKFCPNIGHGSVIVTTRIPDLVDGQQVRVQALQTIDDSLEILRTRSHRDNIGTDLGARRLAERLGGLPLALVTAASYLRNTTLTFQQYLDTYEERWKIGRRPVRLQEYKDRTLYTTWDLSYQRLLLEDPDAANVLKLLAYFDNQEIWYDLVRSDSLEDPKWMQSTLAKLDDFHNVMRILVEYCLVEAHHATYTYSIHGCVHDWLLGGLNESIDPHLYVYALRCLGDAVYTDDVNELRGAKYDQFSRHALRLTHKRFEELFASPNFYSEDCIRVVVSVGWLLLFRMHFSAGERLLTCLLDALDATDGSAHKYFFHAIEGVGEACLLQGRYDKAEAMYMRTIAIRKSQFGPDDLPALVKSARLGTLYMEQQKYEDAKQVFEHVLTRCQLLETDENDNRPLWLFNNVARWYYDRRELDLAEQMAKRALTGFERLYGSGYIESLTSLNLLAWIYDDQDKRQPALVMYMQVLALREGYQGPIHHRTLSTVYDIALLHWKDGRLDEGEEMVKRVLVGCQNLPKDPEVLDLIDQAGKLLGKLEQDKARSVREECSK